MFIITRGSSVSMGLDGHRTPAWDCVRFNSRPESLPPPLSHNFNPNILPRGRLLVPFYPRRPQTVGMERQANRRILMPLREVPHTSAPMRFTVQHITNGQARLALKFNAKNHCLNTLRVCTISFNELQASAAEDGGVLSM